MMLKNLAPGGVFCIGLCELHPNCCCPNLCEVHAISAGQYVNKRKMDGTEMFFDAPTVTSYPSHWSSVRVVPNYEE